MTHYLAICHNDIKPWRPEVHSTDQHDMYRYVPIPFNMTEVNMRPSRDPYWTDHIQHVLYKYCFGLLPHHIEVAQYRYR